MPPRVTTFTCDTVLKAALDIVRRQGWEALTARNVAVRLGASVAPVYSAFSSMEGLMRAALEEIRRRLNDYMAKAYTEIPFLNIGVGIVSFARDEPMLYQAFFQTRHGFKDILDGFNDSLLAWMKADSQLGFLSEASRQRLYDNIGYFTVGLASVMAAGRVPEVAGGDIVRLLKNMGNIVMFAEVSGITDCDSPENTREWMRIMKERNMPVPPGRSETHQETKRRAGSRHTVRPSFQRKRAKETSITRRKHP